MEVLKKESLPSFCLEDKHEWIGLTVHGCGALPDDHALAEAIVIGTKKKDGPGTVCNKCFQKWERPGERDLNLVAVYLEHKSWE